MSNLRPRQPGLAQPRLVESQQASRLKHARQRRQPAPDRRGRLVADHLAADGAQQPGEARVAAAPGQRARGRLDAGEVRIEAAEFGNAQPRPVRNGGEAARVVVSGGITPAAPEARPGGWAGRTLLTVEMGRAWPARSPERR